MIICNKCGAGNPDGGRFCENCGAPLAADAPAAAAPAAPTAQPVQPAYTAKPVAPAANPADGIKQKKENPHINDNLSIWGFIWTLIVMAIPVVNLVFVLIWAFRSGTNKNRRHFAWATIILFLVFALISISVYFFVPGVRDVFANAADNIKEWVEIIRTVKANPEIFLFYRAGIF